MKTPFLILLLILLGCETKVPKKVSKKSNAKETVRGKIEVENRKYFIGDVNNDQVNDTAFINFKWNTETNEIECGKNNCLVDIVFNDNIPKISYDQSLGIVVTKTEDLNRDNANEIIIFSRTHEGWWNEVSVWSFKNKTWHEMAKTNAFISEDKDFENRIVKENREYYLIGENKWEEDEKGNFKIVKVKIVN